MVAHVVRPTDLIRARPTAIQYSMDPLLSTYILTYLNAFHLLFHVFGTHVALRLHACACINTHRINEISYCSLHDSLNLIEQFSICFCVRRLCTWGRVINTLNSKCYKHVNVAYRVNFVRISFQAVRVVRYLKKTQSNLYRSTYLLKCCNVFRRVSAPCWSESAPCDGCLLFSDSQIDSFVEIVPKVSETLITIADTRIRYSRRENRNATCNFSIIDTMHSLVEPLSIEKSVRRNRAVVQRVSL